jgi:predicted outer membrane protein
MRKEYASTPKGIAMLAADQRKHFQSLAPHDEFDEFDKGYAARQIAAFSAVLGLILGTRDEAQVRERIADMR